MSPDERAALRAQLAVEIDLLAKANTLYSRALIDPRESYTLDSGDGRISAKYRGLDEIQDAIKRIEGSIASKRQRLKGIGIATTILRRY